MATLIEVVGRGDLMRLRINLSRHEYPDRFVYATPHFMKWLKGPVMTRKPFFRDSIRPALQAHAILKQFVAGKAFHHPRLFKRMSPLSDDVWELRTDDLRFFGWFHRVDCFIACSGGFFEDLKADRALYETHRLDAIAHRNNIDLDEPKYLKGAKHHDVISE